MRRSVKKTIILSLMLILGLTSQGIAAEGASPAKSQLAAMTNEVYFLIGEKIAENERTERQMELLKTGIIPQATLSLDSVMSAYRGEQGGLYRPPGQPDDSFQV